MISAEQVKLLRELTGAGMLECKKALEEANGDIEKAKEILRVRGLAKAEKKAGRVAKEGIVYAFVSEDRKKGVLIELNCETDFVARNELFNELALRLAKHIAHVEENKNKQGSGELVADQPFFEDPSKKVQDVLKEYIARIGENIVLRRFARFDAEGYVHAYVHGIGRVGVLLEFKAPSLDDSTLRVVQDIAMQIAAMKPEFVSVETIPQDVLERERKILAEQTRQEGKPENLIDRIVEGKLKKFYQEKVLLEQPFIKDDKKRVADYIKEALPELKIERFVRFEVGEG
ncbi:translation elongation factor Ts [Thermocrinis minervae]|uniref:Elongation factor Ts n=1 Tax=Thermocrinis minervae TaxID=381751 RepID=A0A1M6S5L3_9AQUI|nr:translation elongation factor Ts [Thermocrinis minervae]SHK39949.1 translation elongation factor Ts (EF-Ts) [Thermocrinis minervae]